MNRKIEFRAWDIKEQKMYYQGDGIIFTTDGKGQWQFVRAGKILVDHHSGDPMQYIGSNDINGNKIFDGDIVKICLLVNDIIVSKGIVRWKKELIGWCVGNKKGAFVCGLGGEDFQSIEKIGNIFENPKFMKE